MLVFKQSQGRCTNRYRTVRALTDTGHGASLPFHSLNKMLKHASSSKLTLHGKRNNDYRQLIFTDHLLCNRHDFVCFSRVNPHYIL